MARNVSDKSFAYKATDAPAAALDGQASMHYNVGTLCSTAGGSRVSWSQVPSVLKFLKSLFFYLLQLPLLDMWEDYGKTMESLCEFFTNLHMCTPQLNSRSNNTQFCCHLHVLR